MHRSISLEKITGPEIFSNAVKSSCIQNSPENIPKLKRKRAARCPNILERYHITIKPKLQKSNSLSELTNISDSTLDCYDHKINFLNDINFKSFYESSGDTIERYSGDLLQNPYMSWKFKGKKHKKKIDMSPETYCTKYTSEYIQQYETENTSSFVEDTSVCSVEDNTNDRNASFPFKSTPSGNLKVQSNQVVFQSATVGVLLADPTQAKVKVKFKGNTGDDDSPESNLIDVVGSGSESQIPNERRETGNYSAHGRHSNEYDRNKNTKTATQKEGQETNLTSLGYTTMEPVDWTRVQLPKKQDLFQEFHRRVHNYINTDTVITIGNAKFHCHRMVLQIYSSFFEANTSREINLPTENVKPEAFNIIYSWMISNSQESGRILRRDNVLDLFCASQYLDVKDLKSQCWSFIVDESLFTEDTAFVLFREARAKGVPVVMDLMVPRIMRFFLPLVASKDFLELDLEELLTFLKSDYICVTSEIEVLMAGVRWLHGDWSSRSRQAIEVMRCVRFGLISPWQLVDIKRNPDNSEILGIVSDPEVQQMVDDGLAYVIIKYWYGNNSNNYYHWIDVLGLTEPAERNWIGEEKNHVTYQEFLTYLEQFTVPKDQMYQQMAMMQSPRRNDDSMPGTLRGVDNDKMRRPKMDFPLPATLRGLSGDKDKLPTMSEFFESRRKVMEGNPSNSPGRSATVPEGQRERNIRPELGTKTQKLTEEPRKVFSHPSPAQFRQVQEVRTCTVHRNIQQSQPKPPPDNETTEGLENTTTDSSSEALGTSAIDSNTLSGPPRRTSAAASYLAAALAASKMEAHSPPSVRGRVTANTSRSGQNQQAITSQEQFHTPQISLFNQSKEEMARANMNKLSTSVLGPSNKTYVTEKSLFNWDRETVLVFGGIDPHTPYGLAGNRGDSIYRFDPVTNTWDHVHSLPEPRHHHSVAFLRGRIYLVGGADPRDDDLRGKSVVVSTVWSFEPVQRSWYSEAGLAVPRKNFGLVAHRKALYAIGGQDKKGRVLRSVEKFDPKTSSWCEVRPLGSPRTAVAAVKYRDYIWVAGGMTGEKRRPVCDTVECYNSETNEWTQIHSLRFPRCFASLFAMNDKLYIIGGAGKISENDKTPSSVSAIDVWEWHERRWRLETELAIPRHGHALAYLGTQIIIIGGVTTIYMRALNNVESYCCERGAWIRGVAPLPTPLSGHSAVILPPASLM